jgi:hypothetical protein
MVLRTVLMIHVQEPSVNPKMDAADALDLFAVEMEMMIAKLYPT